MADNVGTYTVDGTRTFSFAGSTSTPSSSVHSSGGKNFGHNLSVYKVRYTATNAFISDAVLTNQWLRDYIGQYGRSGSGYKQLILNTGALANYTSSAQVYSVAGTYGVTGTYHAGDTNFTTVRISRMIILVVLSIMIAVMLPMISIIISVVWRAVILR